MRLKGKVALVTGAGQIAGWKDKVGHGRAVAVLFAQEGARVVVADIVRESAEETVEIIKKNGGEAIAVQGDVTKESDAKRMVETAVSQYGRLDILDNNVGFSMNRNVVDMSEEEWDRIMAGNLKGTFLMCKHAIPAMLKGGGGSIINIGSTQWLDAQPGRSAYGTAKAGIIYLTKCMAIEYAPHIRVNCVTPGLVDTAQMSSVATPDGMKARLARIPLGRFGRAEEMAQAVLFFASEESSSWVTGQVLAVDGGVSAGQPAFQKYVPK
ncbi:MAG: glucose 1-dehydrogenase [Dehalococcoidales bacterium]|nr:glucose 1-dehydrogenase [Dehalococcoidales bacterium]